MEKFEKDYSKRGIVIDEVEGLSWYGLFFGCNKPITKEVKFRQACAYAIDRKMVTDAATRGYAAVNSSFVAVRNHYYTPAHKKWYPKDVNKAKQLLPGVRLQGRGDPLFDDEEVCHDLRPVGRHPGRAGGGGDQDQAGRSGVAHHDGPDVFGQLPDDEFRGFGQTGPGPRTWRSVTRGSRNSFPAEGDPGKANATLNFEARKKLFEEAHGVIYDGVPAIVAYNYNHHNAYWNYVKGFKLFCTNQPRFWNVWMEK